MIKNLLPILTIVGTSLFITGCSNNITTVGINDLKAKETDNVSYHNITKNKSLKKTLFNKYNVEIDSPTTLELTNDNLVLENDEQSLLESNKSEDNNIVENSNSEEKPNQNKEDIDKKTIEDNETSTIYSLSKDVEAECDDFCELKEKIGDAILQTETLISKIENNEIELTREQRLYINEQTMQLKSLGKRLSNAATELSFNLSDLKQILNENNADVNQLSLKYLIVLDNLVNSNEMLQSGLTSLNMMNNMITNNPNNRILFGYQKNNEEPIIKDYSINENGDLVENSMNANQSENSNGNKTTDTFTDTKLKSNIDTYYSNNPKNIDTFFNTALFNNEFMYGNGGYGFNPYINQYANYENINSNSNQLSKQNNNNNEIELDNDGEKAGNKEKKFKIKKNIDTYRDANTPNLKTRISSFKEKFNGLFGKINPKENLKNPVYRF